MSTITLEVQSPTRAVERVGGSGRGSAASRLPTASRSSRVQHPAIGIDHAADAVIGGAHQRQSFLDRAGPGDGEMLEGPVLKPYQASLVTLRSHSGRRAGSTTAPGKIAS